MSVWLLRAPGRTVLVDAGFQRDDLIQRWKPEGYLKPSEAVARFGVKPEDVTDVIISHVHWDHMDGVELFPKARLWIQKEEYDAAFGADASKFGFDPSGYVSLRSNPVKQLQGDHDVFGDGTVIIKRTLGHTPGHQRRSKSVAKSRCGRRCTG